MATIRITNLRLQAVIGTNDWERIKKQNIVINLALECNAAKSSKTDRLKDTLDYKAIQQEIVDLVESSRCYLLEKLGAMILKSVMSHKKVKAATVRIDKPGALRFADSVSVEMHAGTGAVSL